MRLSPMLILIVLHTSFITVGPYYNGC